MHGIPGLYYANVDGKGRGVFCTNEIHIGDTIEICPVIVLDKKDLATIHNTALHDYYFLWGENQESCAIALGYGSLYNHSDQPNASFEPDVMNKSVDFICIRDIPSGEEILVDYHEGIRGTSKLWFDVL